MSDHDSKATVAINDDDEAGQAQRDVLHTRIVDLCNNLTGLLEQSNLQHLKEPILALKRAILPEGNPVENIAVNSENDVKLKLPTSLVVDTKGMKLFYNGPEIQTMNATDEYKNALMNKVNKAQLIKEGGLMDESNLFKLVANATNNNCQKFRPQRAAMSTNMVQESIKSTANCGEMFLQQVVYSPIAELFSCFDLSMYCADQHIAGAHAVQCKIPGVSDTYEWNQVRCNPDAAIKLTDEFYLIAMMEIKADSGINERDMYRCRLMTSVSLLALREFLLVNHKDDMSTWENLAIPFVLGNKNTARLYVTRFEMKGDKPNVVFTHLNTVHFCSMETYIDKPPIDVKKAEFMSILAILVAEIVTISRRVSDDFMDYLEEEDFNSCRTYLPNAIGRTTSHTTRSGSRSTTASSKKARLHERTPGMDDPNARENAAENVASWNGLVQKLTYPFWRVRTYDLSEDEVDKWEADMAFYQQKSPFYFRGYYGFLPVFCKVWREGDSRTSRDDIVEEIAMNRLANVHGIPSPRVIDELTAVDVESQDSIGIIGRSTGCTYHVLVTEYHRNDNVAEEDALEFAILLVQAVLNLHKIGVLHCDIKRSNILWNAELKVLRLVDFGLAQNEENARSYHATRMYEAPEIRENHPHSRMSDAFAVGKTMECVVGENIEGPVLKEVLNVAKLLQCPVISDRLSLDKAESMLFSLKESLLSATRSKRHFEDMQKEDIIVDCENESTGVPLLQKEDLCV